MKAYQADIAKFESTDTQVFGMSVDSVPANREFAKQIGVTFPLLSDFLDRKVSFLGFPTQAGNRHPAQWESDLNSRLQAQRRIEANFDSVLHSRAMASAAIMRASYSSPTARRSRTMRKR